jgi:hypothetical protein
LQFGALAAQLGETGSVANHAAGSDLGEFGEEVYRGLARDGEEGGVGAFRQLPDRSCTGKALDGFQLRIDHPDRAIESESSRLPKRFGQITPANEGKVARGQQPLQVRTPAKREL